MLSAFSRMNIITTENLFAKEVIERKGNTRAVLRVSFLPGAHEGYAPEKSFTMFAKELWGRGARQTLYASCTSVRPTLGFAWIINLAELVDGYNVPPNNVTDAMARLCTLRSEFQFQLFLDGYKIFWLLRRGNIILQWATCEVFRSYE